MITEWYLSTILVSGGLIGAVFLPTVQSTLKKLFDLYIGDIYMAVYKASQPELLKTYNLGLRILGLIAGLFVLLFMVELVVRLIVLIVCTLLRSVGILSTTNTETSSTSSSKNTTTATAVESDVHNSSKNE